MRKKATLAFVFVGLPVLAGIAWLMASTEPHGRGYLMLDVPADVDVSIGGHALRRCADEFEPPASCKDEPTPGWSRRFVWSVPRGQAIDVIAVRGARRAASSPMVSAEGPTPHLRFDDETFAWVDLGGVIMKGKTAYFVDKAGVEMGLVGHSEPD